MRLPASSNRLSRVRALGTPCAGSASSARPLRDSRGAVLIVALLISALIAVALGSYLNLNLSSSRLAKRSFNGFAALNREDALPLSSQSATESPAQSLSAVVQLLELRRAEGQFVSSFDLARFHALLGNKSLSLDWLERAVEERRIKILSAKVLPAFKELRGDPRFHAIFRRLRLGN